MELIPLNCNNCGSKLKVGEDTKFVTCKQCDAQLAVRHEDGATFTDVLDAAARVEASAAAIEEHVEKLGADNEKLFLQGEVERLDREWESGARLHGSAKGRPHAAAHSHDAVVMGAWRCWCSLCAMLQFVAPESNLLAFVWVGAWCSPPHRVRLHEPQSASRRDEQALASHEAEREQLLEKLRQL